MNRGVGADGIDRHRHHGPPRMLDGGRASRFVAQLHDDTTVDIAEDICLGHAHRLGQCNSRIAYPSTVHIHRMFSVISRESHQEM